MQEVPSDSEGRSWAKQLIHSGAVRGSEGPLQHSSPGEMISKAGNHSFNYIFCSLFSSPFPHSSSLLPLYICLDLAPVYGQTFVTLPPSLWLLLSFCVKQWKLFFFFSFSFQVFLHLSTKPLSFPTVRCPA